MISQANRLSDNPYLAARLRGIFSRTKRGFYHGGRFATPSSLVNHYNHFKNLSSSEQEKNVLVEYLQSLSAKKVISTGRKQENNDGRH